MSDETLAELERLAAAATRGPWVQDGAGCLPWHVSPVAFSHAGRRIQVSPTAEGESEIDCIPDAMFIAAAREAVPLLIAEIRRLRAASPLPMSPADWAAYAAGE